MATEISPALKRFCSFYVTLTRKGWWFCGRDVERFFDIPVTARRIWVEGSTEQWPDESGVPFEVRLRGGNADFACYWNGHRWCILLYPVGRRLKRMGIGSDPTTIYVCVWYEE